MADVIYLAIIVGGLAFLGFFYYRYLDIVLDTGWRPPWRRARDLFVLAAIAGLAALVGLVLLVLARL